MMEPSYAEHDPRSPYAHAPNKVFFGRFGMRAGWSALIFLLIAGILAAMSGMFAVGITGHSHEMMAAREAAKAHPGAPHPSVHIPFTPSLVIAEDAVIFAGLLFVCFIFSRAEHRRFAAYGIGRARIADAIPGALWGIVSMSALVAMLRGLHLLVFDSQALHGAAIVRCGAAWLLAFTLVGFAEEYEFRGYLQFTLMRGFWGLAERMRPQDPQPAAFWTAAVVMSLVFGALHGLNGGETLLGLAQVVLIGLVFSYALWRTGSLWWGIGFHALWDFMQSFTFGVADSGNISVGRLFITHPTGKPLLSGGPDGPEGSVYAVIFVLLTLVVVRFTTKPGQYAMPEQLPLHEESLPPESVQRIA